jgi:hypothetical protein
VCSHSTMQPHQFQSRCASSDDLDVNGSFPLVCSEFTTIAFMWPCQLQISTMPIMMCCRRLQDSRSDIDFTSCFTYSTTMLYVRSSSFPDLALWEIKINVRALFIHLFSKEHALQNNLFRCKRTRPCLTFF